MEQRKTKMTKGLDGGKVSCDARAAGADVR